MPGEPKRRHSKSRKRIRRAAIKLAVSYVVCKNCGKPGYSHVVCQNCGFYGGKAVSKETVKVTKA